VARAVSQSMPVRPSRALRLPAAVLTLAIVAVVAACGGGDSPEAAGDASVPTPRLYLAGDQELWIVDVATDRARHVRLPQLAPGDPPYRILRRGRPLVL
jgi:hypothetical protein